MKKVNVYQQISWDKEIVAKVKYNDNLDYWDGSNWSSGSIGGHKGLTRLKNGKYVLISGTQWEGARDTAKIISADRALREVLNSGNLKLLKKYGLEKKEKELIQEEEE